MANGVDVPWGDLRPVSTGLPVLLKTRLGDWHSVGNKGRRSGLNPLVMCVLTRVCAGL